MFFNLQPVLKFLNEYASLISVAVTLVYVYLTYKTIVLMKRQIIANIKISKASLRLAVQSRANGTDRITSWEELKKKLASATKDSVLLFYVSVDFVNISSGSGTVDSPKLVLKLRGSKIEHKIRPTKERIGGARQTIYLSGGGFEKADLEYFISATDKLFDYLKKCPDCLECFLSCRDNFGREHKALLVNNIK